MSQSEARKLSIIYSGNLDGELEPCGCSEGGNKGGIKRRVQKIDELKKENPNAVLISAGGLLVSEMPQDRLKSEYILKGLAQLPYDAIGVQWRDLAFSEQFLLQHSLPWVSSNWLNNDFAASKLIQSKHTAVRYFQWLDPASQSVKNMGLALVDKNKSQLMQALAAAKTKGETTVLASTLSLSQLQKEFDLQNVDIAIIKAKYEEFGDPQQVGHTLILQPGSRGMRIAQLDLVINPQGKIKSWRHEVIPLPPEVKDAPRMTQWYDDYNAQVKADYQKRVEIRKAMDSGESPYAGEKVCQNCHMKQHAKWFDSRHAQAFYALQDVNKAFDPDCIACHTVGFEKPGGFIDSSLTANLMHVQCESCHGAGKAHADSSGRTSVANKNWKPKQMCDQCHIQKHSPDFVFEKYWPKIAH
ncbi:MAG: multiheme c-type cytochrome [Gammaproteobacteria bacterium]|nr:multiheme c-type cytochrome [Gammaproteobacteria bacterium]